MSLSSSPKWKEFQSIRALVPYLALKLFTRSEFESKIRSQPTYRIAAKPLSEVMRVSMLTNLLSKLGSTVLIHRLINSFHANLVPLYSMRLTLRSMSVREWVSLREKNKYDSAILVMKSRDEAFVHILMAK